VSTVLRPVGPLPPRVYWQRRAIPLGALFVVILIIAVSCSGGGSKKPGANAPNPSTTNSPGATAALPCQTSQISLTLTSDKPTYVLGETPAFTGTFSNTSATACKLTFAPSNETWTVTSGTDQIWTTTGCTSSQIAETKTIRPGRTRSVSITWNGKRIAAGCKVGGDIANGTYVLNATLDGIKAPQPLPFHFVKATQ